MDATPSPNSESGTVERVTTLEPTLVATTKSKNPKKVAAGRAGAAARKAKQEKILDELRAAKQTLHSPEEHAPPVKDTNTVPMPVRSVATGREYTMPVEPNERTTNWIPLIVGAGLVGGVIFVFRSGNATAMTRRTEPPRAAGADTMRLDPPSAQQLKGCDPFLMD